MMAIGTVPVSHSGHARPASAMREDAAEVYAALAALFGALADPTRVRIVHLLLERELCTSDLGSILGVSDSAVSQHLRVLRSLRLVRSRRSGKFLFHSLDDAHIALLVQIGWAHVEHGGETDARISMEAVS